jgi:hypothetical protein
MLNRTTLKHVTFVRKPKNKHFLWTQCFDRRCVCNPTDCLCASLSLTNCWGSWQIALSWVTCFILCDLITVINLDVQHKCCKYSTWNILYFYIHLPKHDVSYIKSTLNLGLYSHSPGFLSTGINKVTLLVDNWNQDRQMSRITENSIIWANN